MATQFDVVRAASVDPGAQPVVPMSTTAANNEPGVAGSPPPYPHLVVRLIATVYQNERIRISVGPPAVEVVNRQCVVSHPAPFAADGSMSLACRALIIDGVQAAVRKLRLRMCVVWGPSACTYVEADSVREHAEPPSGGIRSVNLEFKPLLYAPESGTI
jgi:hypothetical protein